MYFQSILIPLDGSKAAEKALDYLSALNLAESTVIRLLRIVSFPTVAGGLEGGPIPQSLVDDAIAEAQQYLDKLVLTISVPRAKLRTLVCMTDPSQGILSVAEREQVDLIVMTSHGRTGARRLFIGSVAEHTSRYAHCPVLIVGRISCESHAQARDLSSALT